MGANSTTDYYLQGSLSSARLSGDAVYPNLNGPDISNLSDYPLPSVSSAVVNFQGSPIKNIVFPTQTVTQWGTRIATTPMTVPQGTYVPL